MPVYWLYNENKVKEEDNMGTTIDTRGLSCPQPVLMTLDSIKRESKGEMEILVDTDTSKENVTRAVTSIGWQIKEVKEEGDAYRIRIVKE
jgi:tRNA 2-thiouridine synthesizing protein A